MTTLDTQEYKGYTIQLLSDEGSESPRDWDNVAELVQLSDAYNGPDAYAKLANVIEAAWERTRDFDTVARYLRAYFDVVAVDSWDDPRSSSRVIGYITREAALANWDAYGYDYREHVSDTLKGELATYAAWTQGEVYGASVEELDAACYGFYSTDEAFDWARAYIDAAIEEQHKVRAKLYRLLVGTGHNTRG